MNKNTRQARAILAKAKKAVVITRQRTQGEQKYIISFGYQTRLSKKAKVGGRKKVNIVDEKTAGLEQIKEKPLLNLV